MAQSPPIEAKVKAATASTFVIALVLAVLNDLNGDAELLAPLPAWLQAIVIAAGPPVVTFLSGWQARHTSRISQL
ncbi:holin [Streptomyces sp. MK37H]|uniref:holin n=1 Tax=Streptomyces sp. MK37H TaxID=2699117 RepID=UPI001B371DBF|nr:holin [Streptomyces sp. MK37H]MBP8532346.1 holin [Streptomyces sp. MK37H]